MKVMPGQLALSKSGSGGSPCPGWSGALSCLMDSSYCESLQVSPSLLDSILSQNMSKETYLCLLELRLCRVQDDIVFASSLQHFAEGLAMLWFD